MPKPVQQRKIPFCLKQAPIHERLKSFNDYRCKPNVNATVFDITLP